MSLLSILRTPIPKPEFRILTVFVTARCGLDCEGCFYGDELNNDKVEMTLDEYRRLAESIGPFHGVLCSGGEPFLRKELPEIIGIFREISGITTADVPTAGVNPDRVESTTRRICAIDPAMEITVGVSFDGPPAYHDRYRKGRNVYQHAVESLKRLMALKKEAPNLFVNVLTVVTSENVNLIREMWEGLSKEVEPDFWGVEIVRPFSRGQAFNAPSPQQIREFHQYVIDVNRHLIQMSRPDELALRISYLEMVYQYQERFYEKGSTGVPCLAGKVMGAVMPDGEVKLCEVLDGVGKLREKDFDFKGIWNSAASDEQRKSILKGDCACTHCVNLGQSLMPNARAQYIRRWREHRLGRDGRVSGLGTRVSGA